MKVLAGAEKVIIKHQPIIISELDDRLLFEQGTSSSDVINFLLKLGYEIKSIYEKHKIKYPFAGNIIAFPIKKRYI
jgi:hypothetical protein